MLGANNGQRPEEHLRLQPELELGADRGGLSETTTTTTTTTTITTLHN
jgi:hypothetical protein